MPEEMVIIVIVVALLNIILFFKVWGMTNNTHKIRLFLEAQRPDLKWDKTFECYDKPSDNNSSEAHEVVERLSDTPDLWDVKKD